MKHKSLLLFLFICILFLFFIFLTYKDYGISWDEPSFLLNGKIEAEHFFDTAYLFHNMQSVHLIHHASVFEPVYYILQKSAGTGFDYERLHLVKALFASQTLLAVFLILRLIAKDKFTPVIGVILLIFFPRWLGDIFDNHVDAISTFLYAWEIYFALKIILERKVKKLYLWSCILSVIAALAFTHRAILMMLPVIFSPFFLYKFHRLTTSKNVILIFSVSTLLFICTSYLTSPYIRYHGLSGLYTKVIEQLNSRLPNEVLFDGKEYITGHLPWFYLPKWIAITTPLITLLFFIIGNIKLAYEMIKNKINSRQLTFLLLGSVFYLPILFAIIMHLVMYDGWRLFLYLSVPKAIIAALGFEMLLNAKKSLKYIAYTLLFINIILTAREMYFLHPYEYIYYNSLVGGLAGASGKYETDYWGKSFKEATMWLISHRITNRQKLYSIYVCDNPSLAFYYFADNMIATSILPHADYFICYTRTGADKAVSKSKTIYTVKREGVVLNTVAKLR